MEGCKSKVEVNTNLTTPNIMASDQLSVFVTAGD